ncbi:hypothetical protein GF319_12620 [Candidatus Bathyarchaeota archaeon]|nr:hypothetical protein [Candidatus Bathyarchaeota archaeon]
MRESLKGFKFKNFREIPEFEDKISVFLDGLDEELVHWRGYELRAGRRALRYHTEGYACLDGDKIVAISFYIFPRKFTLKWLHDLIFRPRGPEAADVVKKDYQKRGIARHLTRLKLQILQDIGLKNYWFRTDADNIAVLNWAEKNNRRIWKKTNKQVYFSVNLDIDKH